MNDIGFLYGFISGVILFFVLFWLIDCIKNLKKEKALEKSYIEDDIRALRSRVTVLELKLETLNEKKKKPRKA